MLWDEKSMLNGVVRSLPKAHGVRGYPGPADIGGSGSVSTFERVLIRARGDRPRRRSPRRRSPPPTSASPRIYA
jgi:hypothetical protein